MNLFNGYQFLEDLVKKHMWSEKSTEDQLHHQLEYLRWGFDRKSLSADLFPVVWVGESYSYKEKIPLFGHFLGKEKELALVQEKFKKGVGDYLRAVMVSIVEAMFELEKLRIPVGEIILPKNDVLLGFTSHVLKPRITWTVNRTPKVISEDAYGRFSLIHLPDALLYSTP